MGVLKKTPIEYARYYLSRLESGAAVWEAEKNFLDMEAALKTAGADMTALDETGKTSRKDMETRLRSAWKLNWVLDQSLPSFDEIREKSAQALQGAAKPVEEKAECLVSSEAGKAGDGIAAEAKNAAAALGTENVGEAKSGKKAVVAVAPQDACSGPSRRQKEQELIWAMWLKGHFRGDAPANQ